MISHEITTSKGEFVVVYLPTEVNTVKDSFCDAILTTHHDGYIETYYPYEGNEVEELEIICKLSEATEEDAKGVVDEPLNIFNPTNPYCVNDIVYKNYTGDAYYWSAIESFHSLLTSKGIDVNNGNWYLFKKI